MLNIKFTALNFTFQLTLGSPSLSTLIALTLFYASPVPIQLSKFLLLLKTTLLFHCLEFSIMPIISNYPKRKFTSEIYVLLCLHFLLSNVLVPYVLIYLASHQYLQIYNFLTVPVFPKYSWLEHWSVTR